MFTNVRSMPENALLLVLVFGVPIISTVTRRRWHPCSSRTHDAARTSFSGNSPLLPWWGGAAMLLIYGVALALVGTFTTLRSDIT